MRDKALAEWNSNQPAWKPVLTYQQLTPAQQSEVDELALRKALACTPVHG